MSDLDYIKKCRIVKLETLSGDSASLYSPILNDDNRSVFENFIEKNLSLFKSEILDFLSRLVSIGKKTGAREIFFKLNEGKPGDGVCALYDKPDKKLRLYCIRYGSNLLILGGGGPKPKANRKLQENHKLKTENYLLREISKIITDRIKNGDISFSYNSNDFIGNLELIENEE